MAIKWSDLKNKTRELDIKFQDETLKVVYYINVVTPVFLQEIRELEDREKIIVQLSKVIKTWDVLDDDGNPLQPDAEFLRNLPIQFINDVLSAISDDMRPPENDEKKD